MNESEKGNPDKFCPICGLKLEEEWIPPGGDFSNMIPTGEFVCTRCPKPSSLPESVPSGFVVLPPRLVEWPTIPPNLDLEALPPWKKILLNYVKARKTYYQDAGMQAFDQGDRYFRRFSKGQVYFMDEFAGLITRVPSPSGVEPAELLRQVLEVFDSKKNWDREYFTETGDLEDTLKEARGCIESAILKGEI